ncbi:MAG: hypothetical protein Q8T13_04945 [Acidobacteriota bacterium]|nr:hypothetical protein [Acidobacteriota bacterium]
MDPIRNPDQFVRIKDAKNPGGSLVLARRDFVEGEHELFDAADAPTGEASEPKAPKTPKEPKAPKTPKA